MKRIILNYISILISIFLIISSSYAHEINKDKIVTIVKDFLKKNPEFIKSTLDNYKITLENQTKQNAIKLYVSGMSAKARGYDETLLDGFNAEFAMPDKLLELSTESDAVLCY